MSALVIMDAKASKVLKVWYEETWDPFSIKDLIEDELKMYRRNPKQFVQSQIRFH